MNRVREDNYTVREVFCSICGDVNIGWNAFHTNYIEALERHSAHHVYVGEGNPSFIRARVIDGDQASEHSGPDPRLATV
jgi:hypothetical protein